MKKLSGLLILFLFSTAFGEENAKTVELYEKIKGAVWHKLNINATQQRWEITRTVIEMVKEANPDPDAQLKALTELSEINKQKMEENKADARNYLWLGMTFQKAKEALTEHPVLSEDNKKSVALYEKIKAAVWDKVTEKLPVEEGAQAKMLEISNTIVAMVKEGRPEKDVQMKTVLDLVKINKQKALENKGKMDYPRYITLHAIIVRAAKIIKE